jgi:hypothetical protein
MEKNESFGSVQTYKYAIKEHKNQTATNNNLYIKNFNP